jgi:hypothetical protein
VPDDVTVEGIWLDEPDDDGKPRVGYELSDGMQLYVRYEQDVAWRRYGKGFYLPARFDVAVLDPEAPYDGDLGFAVEKGTPWCQSIQLYFHKTHLTIIQTDGMTKPATLRVQEHVPLTSAGLRQVPVARWIRRATNAAMHRHARPIEEDDFGDDEGKAIDDWSAVFASRAEVAPSRRVLDDAHHERVAQVYRQALKERNPQPVNAVKRAMAVSRSTAGRYVALARAAGYLEAAPMRGKAGEIVAETRRKERSK